MTPELLQAIGEYIIIPICAAAVVCVLLWRITR